MKQMARELLGNMVADKDNERGTMGRPSVVTLLVPTFPPALDSFSPSPVSPTIFLSGLAIYLTIQSLNNKPMTWFRAQCMLQQANNKLAKI